MPLHFGLLGYDATPSRDYLTNPTHVTSGVGRLYFLSAVCGMLVGLVAGNNNFTNHAISTHFDTVSNPGEEAGGTKGGMG